MSRITEKDIIKLEDYSDYANIKDIESDFRYDDYEFDDEVRTGIFWKIFAESNPAWLNKLERFISKHGNKRDEVKSLSIYWAKYQDDLMDIYNKIDMAYRDLDAQVDDIEVEIRDAQSEKDTAVLEYTELGNKIEKLTSDWAWPTIEKKFSWTIDYSEVDKENMDDIKSECEDLLDDMKGWKEEWDEKDSLIDEYENLLEMAKANIDFVENFKFDLEEYMYEL